MIIAVLIWTAVFQNNKTNNNLKIVYCDVGQGDAIFIQKSVDEDFLIDGGPDNSVLSCLGENMPFYDRKIKSIILTHPHADHISGLIEVLKRYQVDEVWLTGVSYDSSEYSEFSKIIQEKSISKHIAIRGETIYQDQDLKLKILYPIDSMEGKTVNNLNNSSMVVRLVYGSFSVIFTGDLEQSAQPELLRSNLDLKSDILKVSHHGSANALLTEFLSSLNPEVAVISVGENNQYGHPAPTTIDLLKTISNIKIFRTDKDGTVKVFSDGDKYWIEKEK